MSIIIATEVVPETQYATIVAIVSLTNCLGLVAGPLVGGAINDSISWRWIFLITLPPIAVVLVIVVFCLPRRFPHHGAKGSQETPPHPYLPIFSRKTLTRVDYPGVWLLLLGTMSLVAALEEAGVAFAWSSDYVISLLVVSVFLWMFFLAWEYHVTLQNRGREPVLPWRLVTQREPIGLLL
jgi:MFS family permease